VAAADYMDLETLYPLPLDSYHRLIEAGAFEGERIELLDGLLVRMSPKSERHEWCTEFLNEWLTLNVERPRYVVGCQRGLTIGRSEPEPDLVVRERHAPPGPYHPDTAVLIVEVALSSLRIDLGFKAPLYASAGIPEYWVLDLDHDRLLVHRDPVKGAYAERFELQPGAEITAAALTLPPLSVARALRL
jgi:Uma2 family endonuclease